MRPVVVYFGIILSFTLILLTKSFLLIQKFQLYYKGTLIKFGSLPDNDKDFSDPVINTDFKKLTDGSFTDSSAVDYIIDEIKDLLKLKAPTSADIDDQIKEEMVSAQFNDLLKQLGSQNVATVQTELTLLKQGVKEGSITEIKAFIFDTTISELLSSKPAATSLYSSNCGPITVVFGTGPVGQNILSTLKSLEPAAKYKRISGRDLAVMQDTELNFALRECKTIIIATDTEIPKQSGWFAEDPTPILNQKSLKRLLNTAMDIRNSRGEGNMKVVLLGKAQRDKKGLASILMSGDAGSIESEAILQCQARGLDYAVVKVGNIITDETSIPKGIRDRNVIASMLEGPVEIERPIAITLGTVEASEVTRLSVATEALLRAASHPQKNSTMSILSSYSTRIVPTEEEWNDEFLKIEGPELLRLPINYASNSRMIVRLQRLMESFQVPGSGLITPIEATKYSNGVKVLFRPLKDSYLSAKEEKRAEQDKDSANKDASAATGPTSKKLGYMSPEKEAALLKNEEVVTKSPIKKKPMKPEGGLEIIVDSSPYRRVRVRRCNMGPDTIVKEESEALLLKEIMQAVTTLENDYKIIYSKFSSS